MIYEKRILTQSVLFAVIFALSGVIVGWLSGSHVIAFDGLYSVMSVLLSLFALLSFRFMSINDWKRFPFGKYNVEPLVVLVQSSVLLGILIVSVVIAFFSILDGGRLVDATFALWYALISAVGCLLVTLYIKHKSKKLSSGILIAEGAHWLLDTYISFGVLITFVVIRVLQFFNVFVEYIAYVDPFVVIIMGLLFAKMPIVQLIEALKDLIGVSADGELSSTLKNIINRVEKQYVFKETFLRVSQGRQLIWIEIDFVVDDQCTIQSIRDQDRVREDIENSLKHIKMEKWVSVSFTTDRKWAI